MHIFGLINQQDRLIVVHSYASLHFVQEKINNYFQYMKFTRSPLPYASNLTCSDNVAVIYSELPKLALFLQRGEQCWSTRIKDYHLAQMSVSACTSYTFEEKNLYDHEPQDIIIHTTGKNNCRFDV